ncbi:MAG TPA: hypothetical protein VN803_07450 [Gemmatimonadales bacterium]|nr:hypothetical protein [Gemmatimonadales bacterium]
MMLSPLDQLLVQDPLVGSQHRIDLGPHPRLDGIESWPDPGPQRIGLGPVPREDRAHRVALRIRELQLALEVLDHGIRATAPASRPATFVALGRFMTTPTGKSACEEHGRQ